MRTAILGGTFNPLHWGHIGIAEEVRSLGGFDRILFIPANIPPHKSVDDPGPELRIEMLKNALAGYSWCEVDTCEVERGGISYSIDTVRELVHKGRVEQRPGLILGDDLLDGLAAWKDSSLLLVETIPVIVRRGNHQILPAFHHLRIDNPFIPFSSSEIRRRIAFGQAWTYMVPESVRKTIQSKSLYGYKSSDR